MPGYLTKLAKEFGLENAKPTATSLPIDVVDKKNDGPVDHERRELSGWSEVYNGVRSNVFRGSQRGCINSADTRTIRQRNISN